MTTRIERGHRPTSTVLGAVALWLALLAVVPGSGLAQIDVDSPERFKEADDAFRARADHERARLAARRYGEIYAADPEDWEAAWRLSMACYFMGVRVVEGKEEQEAFYAKGRDAARRAIELAPDCATCHLFAGINMALYGDSVGVIKMLFSVRQIRSHLKQSLALDPRLANGAAARTLALIDQKLPRVLGGSHKRAKAYFEQAIELDPDEPLNYLYYAEFLNKTKRDPKAALVIAERGRLVPQPPAARLESLSAVEDLTTLVAALKQRVAQPPRKSTLGVRRKGRRR